MGLRITGGVGVRAHVRACVRVRVGDVCVVLDVCACVCVCAPLRVCAGVLRVSYACDACARVWACCACVLCLCMCV